MTQNTKKKPITNVILWIIYGLFLASLLPHTAWAFKNWEPSEGWEFFGLHLPQFTNWVLAISFELTIAVLTHQLSKRIENTPRYTKNKKQEDGTFKKVPDNWEKNKYRYGNWFFFLLVMATGVSVMANLAHAVEFGGNLKIFTEWGLSPKAFAVGFGGILPIMSQGFANVLSDVTESEAEESPELIKARNELSEAKKLLRESELRLKASEDARRITEEEKRAAEARMDTMGDLVKYLFAEDRRQRIIFVKQKWPGLKNSAIALITDTSEAHVSETLQQHELVAG